MVKIKINNMQFYSYNGVLKEEKILGQKIEIDIEIKLPIEEFNLKDNINNTVNYSDVYKIIKSTVEENNFNLIESLANKIRNNIFNLYKDNIVSVCVRIRKYSVPINGIFDNVEIEVGGD